MLTPYFNPSTPPLLQSRLQSLLPPIFHTADRLLHFNRPLDFYFTTTNHASHLKSPNTSFGAESFASGVTFIEVANPDFTNIEFTKLLFHELNHQKRSEIFNVETHDTLLHWIVFEGLATTFENEAIHASPHRSSLPSSILLLGLKTALHIDKHNILWNYEKWFFNFPSPTSDPNSNHINTNLTDFRLTPNPNLNSESTPHNTSALTLPQNFGYHLGEFLITNYCQSHRTSPSQITTLDPTHFHTFATSLTAKIPLAHVKTFFAQNFPTESQYV